MRIVLLTAALVAGVVCHAAERAWQTGTWGDVSTRRQMIDFGPGSSTFGPPRPGVEMRALADVSVYVIETDTLRIEMRDTVAVGRRSIDVSAGAPVTFALEKNSVYVRDEAGVEHKLRVTKKTVKTPARAEPYAALGGGHLLREVSRDGRYIVLEDGSRWEVHPRDWYQTVSWERSANVTVRTARGDGGFDYELVNTTSDEGALAKYAPKK